MAVLAYKDIIILAQVSRPHSSGLLWLDGPSEKSCHNYWMLQPKAKKEEEISTLGIIPSHSVSSAWWLLDQHQVVHSYSQKQTRNWTHSNHAFEVREYTWYKLTKKKSIHDTIQLYLFFYKFATCYIRLQILSKLHPLLRTWLVVSFWSPKLLKCTFRSSNLLIVRVM